MDRDLDQLFETVSGYFALLAEPTRLKILNALCDGEHSVSDIVTRTELTQTNVSRHLNFMFARGVLNRRREGAMTFYSIADKTMVTLCRTACVHVASLADERKLPTRAMRRFMAQT